MRDLAILFIRLFATIARLMRPGGGRAVVAESLLVKHQLLILNRGRERAPNLRPMDRAIAGLCTLFIRPGRLLRIAVVLKPSTLLAFHAALVKRKYRHLFSPIRRGKPGPKGPSPELIAAIVETKRRNPSWGCRRIAQQLCLVFGLEIDKDVVRRVLAKHYRSDPGAYGPSWLTVLGHTKRQPMEHRSVPLRIPHSQKPLGARRHGSVHTSNHWLWHTRRGSGWNITLSDVQPRDSWSWFDKIPQQRS